jgi:hypothetical protein
MNHGGAAGIADSHAPKDDEMDAKLRKKTRETIAKLHADMLADPEVHKALKKNPIRVLVERGLDLDQIVEVHDAGWREGWCPGGSATNA